jgi:hypothetical protein
MVAIFFTRLEFRIKKNVTTCQKKCYEYPAKIGKFSLSSVLEEIYNKAKLID